MVDLTFETYLGKCLDGRYLLYLDDADINLFEIIGYDKINKIVFDALDLNTTSTYNDLVAYEGEGELSDIYALMRQYGLQFDLVKKIYINENIELVIAWWEDHIIVAEYDLIMKCIQTKKKSANTIETDVLDLILTNPNTYYQTQDGEIVVEKKLKPEEFYSFIISTEHYLMKEQNLLLDFEDDD